MAGLFNILDNDEGRFNLGLLAAAAPRATRTGFGERMQDAMGDLDRFKAQKRAAAMDDLVKQKTEIDIRTARANEAQAAELLRLKKLRSENLAAAYGGTQVQQGFAAGAGPGLDAATMSALPKEFQTPVVGAMPGYQPPQGVLAQGSPRKMMHSRMMQLADAAGRSGDTDSHKMYMDEALKLAPKWSTTPHDMMVNGKRMQLLISEDGDYKTLDGVTVPPKFVKVDDGKKQFFVNENDPAIGAKEWQNYMTPGQEATAAAAKASNDLGWANLKESRLRRSDDSKGTLIWSEAAGSFINNRTGKTAQITDGATGQPVALRPVGTEDQNKGGGWYGQALNAYADMKAATDPTQGGDPKALRKGWQDRVDWIPGVNSVVNQTRTADRQTYIRAVASLSEAVLRAATGAGVNITEAQQKINELTPQFGEKLEETERKEKAMRQYLDALRLRSGPNASTVERRNAVLNPPTQEELDKAAADRIIANKNRG